ncbi:MAG: dihydrolipoamide acetyltransferase family protein [Alphaproteobacteria bacterium]
MSEFVLPDLGEGLQEAEIVTWHVNMGDQVVTDQPLVSVETDKAVVEIPSPRAGRITRLFAASGEIVKVGAPLVAFDAAAAADQGGIVGEIEATGEIVAEAPTAEGPAAAAAVKATPAMRALARHLGVDLAVISPSGPDGAVTKSDVERAAKVLADAGPLEPVRGVRRAMALRMAQANAEVASATVVDDADIDAWPAKEDVTIRLIRALMAGCEAEPSLNAWYDSRASGRRIHGVIDLGIAVDTKDGLFVPVLRNIGGRDSADIRSGVDRMKVDIKERTVPPEELRGATITLSNFGTIAGRYATPIVVPPQVAILSAGRIAARVVAVDGEPAVRRTLPLSLTFDHRAVSGGEASRFLAAAMADLELPD